MAEFVLKKLILEQGLASQFIVDSASTSTDKEIETGCIALLKTLEKEKHRERFLCLKKQ